MEDLSYRVKNYHYIETGRCSSLVQVKKMNGKTRHCVVPHESTIGTLKVIIAEKEYTMHSQRMWNQMVEAYCCTWWNMYGWLLQFTTEACLQTKTLPLKLSSEPCHVSKMKVSLKLTLLLGKKCNNQSKL